MKQARIMPTLDVFTEEESARLIELESTIREGEQAFIAVGLALAEISKRRLYRQRFRTFEAYVEQQWGWRRQHGYELIRAARVVENVRSNVQTPPSLSQAIHLASLPPMVQQDIAGRVDFSQTSVRELQRIVRVEKMEAIGQPNPPTPAVESLPILKDEPKVIATVPQELRWWEHPVPVPAPDITEDVAPHAKRDHRSPRQKAEISYRSLSEGIDELNYLRVGKLSIHAQFADAVDWMSTFQHMDVGRCVRTLRQWLVDIEGFQDVLSRHEDEISAVLARLADQKDS